MPSRGASEGLGAGSASIVPGEDAIFIPYVALRKEMFI